MTRSEKLQPGSPFPRITVNTLNGEEICLGELRDSSTGQVIVVYRGQHCPLCTRYLNELETYYQRFLNNGLDVVAVSGDSEGQLKSHLQKLEISYSIAYGLKLEQMEQLGVYISNPRSPEETDHRFSEPALFVVNDEGAILVIDISNNPFTRPTIQTLISGLEWVRNPDNHYPIRGTYSYQSKHTTLSEL